MEDNKTNTNNNSLEENTLNSDKAEQETFVVKNTDLSNSVQEEINDKSVTDKNTNKGKKRKKQKSKIILSVVAALIVCCLVVSTFGYVVARKKYVAISTSIKNMNTSDESFKENIEKSSLMYDLFFKGKNEDEIITLIKSNLYDATSTELVNLESIEKTKKIKKLCDDFKLDKNKYANIYLYIETVIGLGKYDGYQLISEKLSKTLPLITESDIGNTSYYTVDQAANALYQFGLTVKAVVKDIENYIYDIYVFEYYNCLTKMYNECIVGAYNALIRYDMTTYQQKIGDLTSAMLELANLSSKVDNAKSGLKSELLKLAAIVKKL